MAKSLGLSGFALFQRSEIAFGAVWTDAGRPTFFGVFVENLFR